MSKIGRLPILIPSGVQVKIEGNEVSVKGSRGELRRSFPPSITIVLKDNSLVVTRPNDEKEQKALHGLTRSLLANMVTGVTQGYEKTLELVGVGYRAQKTGDKLVLQLGFTHPVEFASPAGITLVLEGTDHVKVQGIDKELVGETAARIRRARPPDSYKGKGIRYRGERVRLKPGKAGKAAAKK